MPCRGFADRTASTICRDSSRHAADSRPYLSYRYCNLFTALVLEVDIDIRCFIPLGADEPFE